MPQKTNLNINPYFDDFDKADNFYKVLFKPGYPVQARELTNLQSILQNQIESFGSHVFKEGSMVIPGGVTYDDRFYAVKVNPDHLGIDVTVYLDALVKNKVRLKGQNSQIVASVQKYLLPPDEGVTDITLFVKYIQSGTDLQSSPFPDGEILLLESNVTYGNTTLNSGDSVLTLISQGATATGSAVGVSTGVYFIRGTFVDVPTTQIVLDPYSNTPSYRVGFNVLEEVITSNDDDSLNDNAKGFTNYAAPGADRLKISVDLAKKSLNDYEDTNFVELVRINNGEIKKLQNTSVYSEIRKYFAQRTYEESGNYAINPFTVNVLNSLNDEISSGGVYREGEKTEEGNTPADNKMCVKVSSGKAYVKGFDVELVGSTVLDVDKPRDTNTIDSALVPFKMGSLLKVNNVYGVPYINLGSPVTSGSNVIKLFNRRRDASTVNAGTGHQIGEARVYWYGVSDAPYFDAGTEWDLYLFDVQTYTNLLLSRPIGTTEVPLTSFVRGLSSGATGYLAAKPDASTFSLTQTSGTFIQGEQVIFNEDTSTSAAIASLVVFTTDDIRSVYQDCTTLNSSIQTDFIADTVLYDRFLPNFFVTDQLTITSAGTATCPGRFFSGATGIKTDSLIKYQKGHFRVPTLNRVNSISADGTSITLSALNNTGIITSVAEGSLPGLTTTSSFSIAVPKIVNLDQSYLYSELPKRNISSVNLSDSSLTVTRQLTGLSVSSGSLTITSSQALNPSAGITSVFFESFDAERYSIHYSDGTTEPLRSDQVTVGSNGSSVSFTGLKNGSTTSNVTAIVTLRKTNVSSKAKDYIRSTKLSVSRTSGISTAASGLTTSKYYGTRIEDREISLNVPDVVKVISVYESTNTSAPVLDKLTFVSGLGLDVNTFLGEKLVGEDSRAIAQLVTRSSATEIEFVYLNSNQFEVGEKVTFKESNIQANILTITRGSYINRTNNYTLDKGHRDQYCDYSRIVRTQGGPIPSKQLMIIYDHYRVSAGSTFGDVFTADSYTSDRYTNDIPTLKNNIRATDVIDFRPRVADFTSTTSSPFAFSSREYDSTYRYVIAPDESSLMGYKYYLPRTDKVVINKLGQVSVIKGTSSDNPKAPVNIDDVMEVAEIQLPPYLYDPVNEPIIRLFDNRRFTMRDIASLESRIKNLETTTTLSALELDTKSLQITDAQGLNRFKTGFVVDNFQNRDFIDLEDDNTKCDVDVTRRELISAVDFWSMAAELALDPAIDPAVADLSSNLKLLDPNIQKTGDLLTLKYNEIGWIEQPQATQVENVNPFNVIVFVGGVVLDPASDNWVRTIYIDDARTESTGAAWAEKANTNVQTDVRREGKKEIATTTTTTTFTNSLEGPSREFKYVESVKISGDADPYMRSRNVYFAANGLKPFTTHYHYLDAQQPDITPKLVEIQMNSGTFQVYENAKVYYGGKQIARIRVQKPNHKFGDTTRPDIGAGLGSPSVLVEEYTVDPYDRTRPAPGESYSPTSRLLNVGVRVLATEAHDYFGYIVTGATVVGETSGAVANVTRSELISDNWGDIIGNFYFRDPNTNPPPPTLVRSGTKTFKVTATPPGVTPLPGSTVFASEAQGTYSGSGTILTQNTTTVSVRNPPPPATRPNEVNVAVKATHRDPLAQTFTVDETGAFLTSFDVYFGAKDPSAKLFVELRYVELGTPTNFLVQDYTQVALNPSDINISTDASVPTRIRFPSPVYLESGREYALVFLSPASDLYEMWVATMGQKTVRTRDLPDVQNVIVSKQYIGGSLFKSQNGTIWTPSQYQDLTFKLYKAEFVSNGKLTFYNTPIEPGNINASKLPSNPVKTLPRKLKVPIANNYTITSIGSTLVPGTKVGEGSVSGTSITGVIEKVGGPISSSASGITTVGVGSNYGPDGTYNTVSLHSITGSGADATANITISGGVVSLCVLNSTTGLGTGFVVGELLGITTNTGSPALTKGSGAKFSVNTLGNFRTHLYLTNVQGEQFNSGQGLIYYSNGARTSLAPATINGSSSVIEDKYSGNVLQVSQYNHAHHGANNKIQIKDIEPDTQLVATTSDLGISSTTVSVANTTPFATFEGISTASGYALIRGEVVSYSDIGTGTLTISGRGLNNTPALPHPLGAFIQPYECNGVSLMRINTTLDIPSTQSLRTSADLDHYYLEFNRTGRSSGASQLSFTDERSVGGDECKVSQNIQFSTLEPQFNIITPGKGTSVSSQIRTVSGTSAGGSEVSFIDQGYEPISLNETSFLSSPRMVASKINETNRLTTLPRNKSLTLAVEFSSEDKNLSPVMDIQNAIFVLGRNRVNNPISDYATDDRSNRVSGDPHGSIFISKRIDLKNPATSLQVLVGANRPPEADFRVFYRLIKADSSEIEQSYIPFPGYDNLRDTNGDGYGDLVIDSTKNNGRPDAFVSPNIDGQFSEYQFTANNLDPFSGFIIKIVMSSTNESATIKLRDFRAIALA